MELAVETANNRLLSHQIQHATELRRYSASVVARMVAVLNRADAAMASELSTLIASMDGTTFRMERLEAMLASVRTMNLEAYDRVGREMTAELLDLTELEVAFQRSALVSVVPLEITVSAVSAAAVHAAAMARPFQGGLLKGYLSEMSERKAKIIRQTIADGFVQGRTNGEIMRSLRGTKARGYADAVIEVTRREAEALVRTAVGHTAAFARQEVFGANEDLFAGYLWVATLDARTSSQCQIRDGREYTTEFKPVGHTLKWGAGPGRLHWNCRSTSTPVLKSLEEMTGVPLKNFSSAERASMDGQLPASTDYASWIKQQSAARQDDILGPSRGKLLRAGGLSLADLYSAQGSPLTLVEIAARHATAFRQAGL